MKVTRNEILKRAREILAECQEIAPDAFEGRPSITFQVSGRMTRTAGSARARTGEIKLSLAFFADRANFDSDFRNTVTHEIAHVLSPPVRLPGSRKRQSHGPAWRAMHRRLGGNGARCHELELAEGYAAKRTRTAVSCSCGCGKPMQLGPTQLKRYRMGIRYFLRGHQPRRTAGGNGPESLRRFFDF